MNWLEKQKGDRDALKAAIWEDESFLAWVEAEGAEEGYRALCEFKWSVTDQIKASRVGGAPDAAWERRATGLVIRLNQRKSQLMRYIREEFGDDFFAELREEIRSDNQD